MTGVPGTGKTTIAEALAKRGVTVVHLNDFARDHGLLGTPDPVRGSLEIDLDDLNDALETAYPFDAPEVVLVEGHFAHELDANLIVLLRVAPVVLIGRLKAREWPETKIRENVEAEALDVLAGEVLDSGASSWEIDATTMAVDAVADEVLAIVEDAPKALKATPVGTAAWPLESLPWF